MDKCKMNKLLDFWLFYNLTKKTKNNNNKKQLYHIWLLKTKRNFADADTC